MTERQISRKTVQLEASQQSSSQQLNHRSVDMILRQLCHHLSSLMPSVDEHLTPVELENVLSMIETTPLPTSGFGVAQNRLRNAQRYAQSDELGAARYELQLLLRQLENELGSRDVVVRPSEFRRQRLTGG